MIALSYPFTLGSNGKAATTSDQTKMYFDKILTLLSTISGQRPMRPDYGTDIPRGVYESGGEYVEGIRQAIRTAMSIWLPNVQINDITINSPGEAGEATVNISVTLPDFTEGTVSINTIYILPDGTTSGQ